MPSGLDTLPVSPPTQRELGGWSRVTGFASVSRRGETIILMEVWERPYWLHSSFRVHGTLFLLFLWSSLLGSGVPADQDKRLESKFPELPCYISLISSQSGASWCRETSSSIGHWTAGIPEDRAAPKPQADQKIKFSSFPSSCESIRPDFKVSLLIKFMVKVGSTLKPSIISVDLLKFSTFIHSIPEMLTSQALVSSLKKTFYFHKLFLSLILSYACLH